MPSMRSIALLLLPLLAAASPVETKRQLQLGSLFSQMLSMGPPMKPVVTELQPQVRRDAKRQQLVWGPFNFVGANVSI